LKKLKQPKWENMQQHVKAFIKKCPACQKMNTLKLSILTIKFTLATYHPMQRISIDTINMDKEPDENGHQYITAIINCFSRWLGNFGVPDEIQADLGTQYVNELIEQFIKFTGAIAKFNIAAHSKEENAILERANKEVLRHLRGIIFERNFISDRSNNLPMVQRIINASKHESIGCSPAQILLGNAINLNNQIFLPSEDRPWNINLPVWLADKITAQDAIIKRAQEIQKIKDDKHMSANYKHRHNIM